MSELAVEAVVEGVTGGAELAGTALELGSAAATVPELDLSAAGTAAKDLGSVALSSETPADADFGALVDEPAAETAAAADLTAVDDSALFGETDPADTDGSPTTPDSTNGTDDPVDTARQQVAAAYDEPVTAATPADGGPTGPDDPTPPTGGTGNGSGDGNGEAGGDEVGDSGEGEPEGRDKPEWVDSELVADEGTTEIAADDGRPTEPVDDADVQEADVVDDEADPDHEEDPDDEADPDTDEEDETDDEDLDPDTDPDDEADPDHEEDPDDEADPDTDEEDETDDEDLDPDTDPDDEADPDHEEDPDDEADPDTDEEDETDDEDLDPDTDPDDEADPDHEEDPDDEADPDTDEEDETDDEDLDPDTDPDDEADPDHEEDPDDEADPDTDEEDETDDEDLDPDTDPDDEADPDHEEDPDDEADPDTDEEDEDILPEGLDELENEFNEGLDDLLQLVKQRDQLARDNPISDELRVVEESIEAVNERLLGVQNKIQELRYDADLQDLDYYIQRRDNFDPSHPMHEHYDNVVRQLHEELTNLHNSILDYQLRHLDEPLGSGRDPSVMPRELLGLHPRELMQIRDAVLDKLNQLYPNRGAGADGWATVGARPFEQYLSHISELLAQRGMRLASMSPTARAAYRARETAAGLRRAVPQGAMRRLDDMTRGNLGILQDRIEAMDPTSRPDYAAEHAQRILDETASRRANMRATGRVYGDIRSAVRDYANSRGLNQNGQTVRRMESESRWEAHRERITGAKSDGDKIGNIRMSTVMRHHNTGPVSRAGGGQPGDRGKGGSGGGGKPEPKHQGRAARTVRAAQRQHQVRREHNRHKAQRKSLERQIEKIRKEHPVRYFMNPLLQAIGLQHKGLSSAQADLNVTRSEEWRTSLPGQVGGAIIDKIAG